MGSDSGMRKVAAEFSPSAEGITSQTPPPLCLTEQLEQGAVGEGWRGVLGPLSKSGIVLDIVAKVGWFENARERLLHEAEIYDLLHRKGVHGVPVLIGLFDDIDDQVPILVTTYSGSEIHAVDDSQKSVNVRFVVCSDQLRP
jgi:hypothetical protein